jgi:biotin operon repressor
MAGVLKNEVWKALKFLVLGSRYPSGIVEELGMSRKTIFGTVKVLKKGGVDRCFFFTEGMGKPREY